MSTADQIKGVIKEAAGRLTGNRRLLAEGKGDRKADQAKAKAGEALKLVNERVDEAKTKAKEAAAKAAERLSDHHD